MINAHNWLVVRYKINQLKRLEHNLQNQNLNFYSPKIIKKSYKTNAHKEVLLFPGYGFIKNGIKNIHSIKYTKGVIDVLKFGTNYAFLSNDKIIELTNAEKISRKKPFCEDFYENDEIIIEDGPLKGQITKILSLQANDRVKVLINILGSLKEIQISKNIIKKI
jgi:transcription antitermination factor NusG